MPGISVPSFWGEVQILYDWRSLGNDCFHKALDDAFSHTRRDSTLNEITLPRQDRNFKLVL